jgi:F0F1-type ATP synthase membrane subunit b/b'
VIAVGVVTRQEFEAALKAADDEGKDGNYAGLHAPLDAGLRGKIAEVWNSIKSALRGAYVHGKEESQLALDKAVAQAESLIASAGAHARDVQQALQDKISRYLSRFVDAALSQVKATVRVGGADLRLDAVEVSQSISLTGSLKASLQEIVGLTSEGQLTVNASYKAPVSHPDPA